MNKNIKYSQNFLTSEKVLNQIIKQLNLKETDTVYEIGKGVQIPTKRSGPLVGKCPKCGNNIVLKKLKIALSLTAEEVISILNLAGVSLSKGELSAVLRKEGHKNYRECGDRYLRNFLKGLAIQYRTVNK